MSRLTVSGLASNLDWRTVITEILRLERAGVSRLESRRSAVDWQAKAWTEVSSRLGELRARATALAGPAVDRCRAESADPARVEVTSGPGAAPGTYDLRVDALATAHRVVSAARTAADEALGLAGTFQVNGCAVTVEAGHTLTDLASLLEQAGVGIRAAVIRAAEGEHYLVLTAGRTGAASAIGLEEGPEGVLTALGLLDEGGQLNTLTPAADAVFQLNGLTLRRPANSVTDAVAGIVFHLRAAGEGTVRVEVLPDHEPVLDAATALVTAYNSALRTIRSSLAEGAALAGDQQLARLQERLRGLVAAPSGGSLSLRDAGVTFATDRSGELLLDRDRLLAALGEDAEAVHSLLAGRSAALEQYLNGALRVGDGLVSARNRALGERKAALGREIQRAEDRLAARERLLTAQFLAMERVVADLSRQSSALAVPLNWLAEGQRQS